jgi:RNA polymerase sigma-70 factor (ECF subfamily)
MPNGDDAELASRCLRGDPEAFEALVARYERVLFNVALRMLGSREDARDVTQTAFVKAYEKLATYDARYRFFSWIYRIMINEALNLLERRKPHRPLDPHLVAPGNPQEDVQTREVSERVQAALLKLPADSREVIVLRHFAELSYSEMSSLLSIPEKTVKSRLHTARQRLSDVLLHRSPHR